MGFVKENTDSAISGLIGFAQRLIPALGKAEIEKTWAGFRPHAKRGQPYMGVIPVSTISSWPPATFAPACTFRQ